MGEEEDPGFDQFLDLLSNTTECLCQGIVGSEYSAAYAGYNLVVIIVLLPVVSAFGLCSNVVNLFIYCQPGLRSSGNTYLAALACSDFFVIICGFAVFWFDSARSYIYELETLKDIVPLLTLTLAFGYIAQTCSVYFTVFAAVDCFVKVCWPAQTSFWCTLRRSLQVVFLVLLGSLGYSSLRFGQFRLRDCMMPNSTVSLIEVCPTRLYFQINTVYNIYMYMVLMAFLPFVMLSILNALIVSKVKRERAAFRSSLVELNGVSTSTALSPGLRSAAAEELKASPARQLTVQSGSPAVSPAETITMIMVVVLFLACNSLALVVNIVETFLSPGKETLNFMTDTSNFLVMFNSSVNCIVYLIFAEDYRECFRRYFVPESCGQRPKLRPSGLAPKANGTAANRLKSGQRFRNSGHASDSSSPIRELRGAETENLLLSPGSPDAPPESQI